MLKVGDKVYYSGCSPLCSVVHEGEDEYYASNTAVKKHFAKIFVITELEMTISFTNNLVRAWSCGLAELTPETLRLEFHDEDTFQSTQLKVYMCHLKKL